MAASRLRLAANAAGEDDCRAQFALPLITRPTEHSGVTFGAATSVLLTGVDDTFGVRRYKKRGMKEEDVETPKEGVSKSSVVPQGGFDLLNYEKLVAVGSYTPLSNWQCSGIGIMRSARPRGTENKHRASI